MPTPTPTMPMHKKNKMSCQVGGCSMPSQTIAWMSTPIAAIPDTDAAMVCM